MDQKSKLITPAEVVRQNNPLITGVTEMSEKWHKRWSEIDRPWPVEGTFNPDVIKTLQVLVSTYKVSEKKGRKGKKRKEKRQRELGILQLFEEEGQKWMKHVKERREKSAEEREKHVGKTEKLMAEIDVPFSMQIPPPYKEREEIYPQLPVINQEGNYLIKNEDEQVLEMGKAETTIKMYPNSKYKKKVTQFQTGGRFERRGESETDQSDNEGAMGGYDPAVRKILVRAERRGGKTGKKREVKEDRSSGSGDGDSDSESEGQSPARGLKKDSQKSEMTYLLRSKKKSDKMCPVIIRGQNLEYKPWQNTDMSDIMEKLPILQDGGHPWISKLEEIMVGIQLAVGDIKRLLANILGVPAMEEILQRAMLGRYVETAVNDSELFAANRGRIWRALREMFPTNVHPDNILIEPLGQEENPRAYVSRAHQVWRNVTGNDPEMSQMEQSILRAKIQKGLPLPVRSKLAEVVGLGSMTKGVYTDHISHQVELYRKKEHDQKLQDQETLRKLTQIQLTDNKNRVSLN